MRVIPTTVLAGAAIVIAGLFANDSSATSFGTGLIVVALFCALLNA